MIIYVYKIKKIIEKIKNLRIGAKDDIKIKHTRQILI